VIPCALSITTPPCLHSRASRVPRPLGTTEQQAVQRRDAPSLRRLVINAPSVAVVDQFHSLLLMRGRRERSLDVLRDAGAVPVGRSGG
jgi:hypothetical protein